MVKKIKTDGSVENDDLVKSLADELNKVNKESGKSVYFLAEKDDPSTITDWVSTGSTLLDLAISNRPHGGLPVSRISTLVGLEGTGKSLICANLVAETQRKGGIAAYIDTEAASAPEFWNALGVDLTKMLYIPQETLEGAFTTIENIIGIVRKSDKNRLCTIILDSIAGASTKLELESTYDRKGYQTGKAILVSEAMRKLTNLIAKQRILMVFTNQLRQNLQAMQFGDKWIEPCGKATSFHSSVKVRFASTGKFKNPKTGQVIGNSVKSVVTKNRMGPPFRTAEFDVYFDSGISDHLSWMELLKAQKIATASGPSFTYKPIEGEPIKTTSAEFLKRLNEDTVFSENVYQHICKELIMEYKAPNSSLKDEVIKDTSENPLGNITEEE